MKNTRAMMAIAAMGAAAVSMSLAMMEPDTQPEPGSAKNRPSGNTPVPGGGAKERAKRLARMAKEAE